MVYESPIDNDGNPYYVPVVAKNRDFLVGYIKGLDLGREILIDVMESVGVKVNLGKLDVVLDSNRFNDILKNGKHESEMTVDDMKEYIFDIFNEVSSKLDSDSSEIGAFDNDLLHVECSCGYGFYSWVNYEDIPEETFHCGECGKVLIHYTGIDDFKLEYDEKGDKHAG